MRHEKLDVDEVWLDLAMLEKVGLDGEFVLECGHNRSLLDDASDG